MAILHRTRNMPALVPRYVERFSCLGPSCEDTCCASWPIHIDKKTYKAYRQDGAPELGKTLSKSLVRASNPFGNIAYAVVVPEGPERKCPVMQDGLCGIHKDLGESYISDLCFSYPRLTHRFGQQIEQAMTLSCPEAARLALLAEDAFEFVEGSVSLRDNAVTEIDMQQNMSAELMNDIRIFCMNVLRTRDLALWQRLAVLGTFCDRLTGYCHADRQEEVPAMLEQFITLIENGELLASLDQIQPNTGAQAMVFATLWAAKGFESPSPFQQSLIERISAGLGADEHGQNDAAGLIAAYTNGLARLDAALEDAPYLLENYLINEMFIHVFPFATKHAYDNYLHLVARFGLLRLLLAAQCNTNGELPSIQTLVSTVHLHCRRFQHDNGYTNRLHESLYQSGWASLGKLYSLLRT